jgi:Got1/Sft2-like family
LAIIADHRPNAQILFLGGLFLIIGPQKTFYFFARKNKLRGTTCFLGGILLVFLKWPTIGVLVELFGFLNLFGCVRAFGRVMVSVSLPALLLHPETFSLSSSFSSVNYRLLACS